MDERSISDRPARLAGMGRALRRLSRDRRGATAVEYGFIIALVVIAMVSALAGVGNTTSTMWNDINSKVSNAH